MEIDHIHLYVEDVRRLALFYVTSYGFRVLAQAEGEDCRSLLLQQGRVRLLLTEALSEAHPAAEYVRSHGDGVKDIALRTPNAVEAFKEAVRRGARPVMEPVHEELAEGRLVRATVATVGDVVHSFIQREGSAFLPGFERAEGFPLPRVSPISELDHLAICLEPGTLEATVRFYEEVLGLRQSHHEDVRTEYSGMNSRVVQNSTGRVCLPLMEPAPDRPRGQIDHFLARHGGPGVQHLALRTEDMFAAVRALRHQQVAFLDIPGGYYDRLEERLGPLEMDLAELRELGVLVDRESWGILLQAFTRSAHPRATLFHELIERRDARGFGSQNVRALFEAVERERARA